MNASRRHALVLGLNDDGYPFRLQDVLYAVGNLCRHLFLHLEAARESFDNASQLADTDNLACRQVADMSLADNSSQDAMAEIFFPLFNDGTGDLIGRIHLNPRRQATG